MSKKIVIRADLIGKQCISDILKVVAKFQGIKSMDVDDDKCRLTVVGVVDPVCIAQKLRKACFEAIIESVEDDKPKEKDPCKEACEKLCKEKCDKACCEECKEKCEKACMDKCEKFCKDKCQWCDKGCSSSSSSTCSCTTTTGCYYTPYATPGCYSYYGRPVGYGGYCYEERSPAGECTIQ